MKFEVQNVVYVRSNGELSHEISLGTVGYLADSLSELERIVEKEVKDVCFGVLVSIETHKKRSCFRISIDTKHTGNGTYFYPTGTVKTIPYTFEEAVSFMGKAYKRKSGNPKVEIVSTVSAIDGFVYVNGLISTKFLEKCVWMDDSPCGRLLIE